jgi:hypothetical protein
MYDNIKIDKHCENNSEFTQNLIFNHFCVPCGDSKGKLNKMSNYFQKLLSINDKNIHSKSIENLLLYKTYIFEENDKRISFLNNNKLEVTNCSKNIFKNGSYNVINKNIIKCSFDNNQYYFKFNEDFSSFVSIENNNFNIIYGKYIQRYIPKIIMQTSLDKPESYIVDTIKKNCPYWIYNHFVDSEIIKYFEMNPINEFPDIVEKFKSFENGAHKADLFRYFYLYLNGGAFLDSDAILEVDINKIIDKYDSIFVKSFLFNQHIFNGFIVTYPNNPIIYKALKHAYECDNKLLQKEYHYFCMELLKILQNNSEQNIKIYQEHNRSRQGYGGSIILDDNKEKILSHYWHSKVIPKPNTCQKI